MEIDDTRIEELRSFYDSCFGCGRANSSGLALDGFAMHGGKVSAPFTPRPDLEGFANTLHGGVIATALDEVSAWAAMLTEGVLVFTATLDLRYRKKADADVTFELLGTVVERNGRRLKIDAEMRNDVGVVAESHGVFVVAGTIDEIAAGQ